MHQPLQLWIRGRFDTLLKLAQTVHRLKEPTLQHHDLDGAWIEIDRVMLKAETSTNHERIVFFKAILRRDWSFNPKKLFRHQYLMRKSRYHWHDVIANPEKLLCMQQLTHARGAPLAAERFHMTRPCQPDHQQTEGLLCHIIFIFPYYTY